MLLGLWIFLGILAAFLFGIFFAILISCWRSRNPDLYLKGKNQSICSHFESGKHTTLLKREGKPFVVFIIGFRLNNWWLFIKNFGKVMKVFSKEIEIFDFNIQETLQKYFLQKTQFQVVCLLQKVLEFHSLLTLQ